MNMSRIVYEISGSVKDVKLYTGQVYLSDIAGKYIDNPKFRLFVYECLQRHKSCDWGEYVSADIAREYDLEVQQALQKRRYEIHPDYVAVKISKPIVSGYLIPEEVKKVGREVYRSRWLFIATIPDKSARTISTAVLLDIEKRGSKISF